MAGSSWSSSTGSSTSEPVIPEISSQLTSLLESFGNYLQGWAGQQIANGQNITDQNIGQFWDINGDAKGMMKNLASQYNDVFAPLLNEFASKAQSWASESRRLFNMGQAESTAAQADKSATEGLKRNLEREGINTSSGAIQEIMRKNAMDDARNRTMAGTQAGLATEQQGMQYLQIASQLGQNLPGMWGMAAGVREAALNSAENSILGMLNAAARLQQLPIQAYQAAASAIKMGQNTRSQQQSNGGSSQTNPPRPESSGGPGGSRTGGPGNQSSDPRFRDQGTGGGPGMKSIENPYYTGPNANGSGGNIKKVGDYPDSGWAGEWWKDPNLGIDPQSSYDWSRSNTPTIDPNTGLQEGNQFPDPLQNTNGGGVAGFGPGAPMVQQPTDFGGSFDQVPTSGQFGVDNIPQPGGPGTQFGGAGSDNGIGWDPSQSQAGMGQFDWGNVGNPTDLNNYDQGIDYSQWQQPDQQAGGEDWWNQPDFGGGADQTGGDQMQSFDQSWGGDQSGYQDYGQPMDQSGGYNDYQPPVDTSSQAWDYSGPSYEDYGSGYAQGGEVGPTTGGHVPRSASPSMGRQTDDIPARLNADEYVIPRDVVRHFGTKHFDSLIAKSRKARTGMAGPQPQAQRKPALQGPPRFVSKPMGSR
jgi:hypothetical protein